MNKSKFLEQISNMSRDDIDEYFKKSIVRTKIIYPVVVIRSSFSQDDIKNKNKSITNSEKGKIQNEFSLINTEGKICS